MKSVKLNKLINSLKCIKSLDLSDCHERSVEKLLISHGFKKRLRFYNKHRVKKRLNRCNNHGNYYIYQPFGSQKPPDFRIYDNDEYFDIECKSSKTTYKPMWNCTIPNRLTYYLFTNTRDNMTKIIKGDKIVTIPLIKLLNEYKSATKELEKRYNFLISQLSPEENPYNLNVYARNMFLQRRNFEK